jgi:glycosyltransferase involved in cell wall biosynthesis
MNTKINVEKNVILTIVVPTFNRPELLIETLESVKNQNTNSIFKVIVIDNNPDECSHIKNLTEASGITNIRYIKNKSNLGMFGNWNRCIEETETEYLTILNDDDLLHENFIEEVSNILIENKNIQLLSTDTKVFGNIRAKKFNRSVKIRSYFDNITAIKIKKNLIKLSKKHYFVGIPHFGSLGIVFKRNLALNINGFDQSWSPISDFVFASKYAEIYGSYKITKVLCFYRIHENESKKKEVLDEMASKTIEYKRKFLQNYSIIDRAYLKLLKINFHFSINKFWTSDLNYKGNIIAQIITIFTEKILRIAILLIKRD